ncbi:MAG: SOS response-associated peptidase [Myxococcales bacterium]|nr:SOS response-associated peptidase [Myxococcales bacterium]
MCGRFTLTSSPEELARRFGIEAPAQLAPRYNIAPGQEILSIRLDPSAARRLAAPVRWGLVPAWAEDARVGFRMINARAETAAQKPAFRAAFRARRCLVPSNGFYEWAKRGGAKQAYHIGLRDRAPFAFAGLWERREDASGDVLESCTLLTTEASPCLRDIHPRMPVILAPADEARWLETQPSDLSALQALLRPLPDDAVVFHAVSDRVNQPRFDDPACLAPASGTAQQGALF